MRRAPRRRSSRPVTRDVDPIEAFARLERALGPWAREAGVIVALMRSTGAHYNREHPEEVWLSDVKALRKVLRRVERLRDGLSGPHAEIFPIIGATRDQLDQLAAFLSTHTSPRPVGRGRTWTGSDLTMARAVLTHLAICNMPLGHTTNSRTWRVLLALADFPGYRVSRLTTPRATLPGLVGEVLAYVDELKARARGVSKCPQK